MKIDEKLSEIFEVEPISKGEIVDVSTSKPEAVMSEEDEADFRVVRSNLYNILRDGSSALEHALEVAKSSEHPRAFEVVGGLMKNLSDINHQLIDLQAKKNLLKPKEKEDPAKTINNNAIFVGSTTELLNMLNKTKRGES